MLTQVLMIGKYEDVEKKKKLLGWGTGNNLDYNLPHSRITRLLVP